MEMLVGEQGLARINELKVVVFGVGGVGGQAAESLARAGISKIKLVDRDVVEISNTNRQIVALDSTIGHDKVAVLAQRIKDINPSICVEYEKKEVNATNLDDFNLCEYDFVVDAIDSIKDKLALIIYCLKKDINIISSMAAGNRLDPTQVVVMDLSKTSYDPFAKIIRSELRKIGLKHLPVVASLEAPFKTGSRTPSSSPFVPPAFGLVIASYIIRTVLMYNIK